MSKTMKNRIWELDALRGLAIMVMLFDHATFDLAFIMPSLWRDRLSSSAFFSGIIDFSQSYWASDFRTYFIWPVFVTVFFFLSGICTAFTRSSARRTIRLVGVAVLITGVTWAIDLATGVQSFLITAGVIHTFAVCAVVYTIIVWCCSTSEVKLCKVTIPAKYVAFFAVAALGAALTIFAPAINAPTSYFFFLLGLNKSGYYSADYIPVLPWLSVFLLGAILSPILYGRRQSYMPKLDKFAGLKPFRFVGKNSLWFYVLHQPIIYALITLLSLICFGELRIF